MVTVKKVEIAEVRCPYCNAFYDYIVPDNFFWGEEERIVWCTSPDCKKPFMVKK